MSSDSYVHKTCPCSLIQEVRMHNAGNVVCWDRPPGQKVIFVADFKWPQNQLVIICLSMHIDRSTAIYDVLHARKRKGTYRRQIRRCRLCKRYGNVRYGDRVRSELSLRGSEAGRVIIYSSAAAFDRMLKIYLILWYIDTFFILYQRYIENIIK
jgi:hypothetical protein